MNYINIKGQKQKIRKEKYDFYYDAGDLKPYVTVCYLWMENGDIARGMSVCSYDDEFDEEEGKRLAKHFAVKSLRGNNLDDIQMKQAITILIRTRCPFTKKGEKNPELSWWERRFVFGSKKMKNYKSGIGYKESFKPTRFYAKDCVISFPGFSGGECLNYPIQGSFKLTGKSYNSLGSCFGKNKENNEKR